MNATHPPRLFVSLLALLLLVSACSESDDLDIATTADASVSVAGGSSGSASASETADVADAKDADGSTVERGIDEVEMVEESEAAAFAGEDMAESATAELATAESVPPVDGDVAEPLPPIEPEPQPEPQAGQLTAADIDDNLNLGSFADLVANWQQDAGAGVPFVNLRDRVVIDLVGGNGVGVGNTSIMVTAGQESRAVVTNSAGRAYLYPGWLGLDVGGGAQLTIGDTQQTVTADQLDSGRLELEIDGDTSPPSSLDVALVLDVTGSMADELRYLTVEFESIVARVEDDYGNVDLRFALVVYRDDGDAFVTRTFDFTNDAGQMRRWLSDQAAGGGGDFPEAMDAALTDAESLSWRDGEDVARVLILNADAPPHEPRIESTFASARALGEDGVRLYPLAASGVDRTAEFLMRAMAVTTGGRHLFLTSDSGIGGEKLEPKADCYVVTRLDDLLYRILASELAGERIEPAAEQIIRSVGEYDRGVCGGQ